MRAHPDEQPIEFIRLPEVLRLTGVSHTTIYRMLASGQFPCQIKLGANSVAWIRSEVSDWSRSKIASSRSPAQ
ncbi:helix-turn-helix transcriptional regulator [Pseudomonas sp. DSP3-2-2]